jgi:hypothetical protein
MENYRYNNAAYAALYKQLSTDTTLEDYCRQMQRSAGAKTVLLIMAVLLVVALSVMSYLRYFHHRLLYRDRMEEILWLSRRLLDDSASGSATPGQSPAAEASDDAFVARWITDLIDLRAHYAHVCLAGKQDHIEQVRDEVNRLQHEENRLHVQNRVLDNCLSALKHETVYYPHRIRQWVLKEREGAPGNAPVESMVELMTYYKEIYTTLTACAARQLDEVSFRRVTLDVHSVMQTAQRTFVRQARRQHVEATLMVEVEGSDDPRVMADSVELSVLFASLFDAALTDARPGQLRLAARADGDYVRFTLTDPRRTLTADELATLFEPHLERMRYVEGDRLTGVEYLIAKQVIRDHDAYTGRRGCRIQAQQATPEGGLTVWFTLPIHKHII